MIQGSKCGPKIDKEASKMETENVLYFFINFHRFLAPFGSHLGLQTGSKIDINLMNKHDEKNEGQSSPRASPVVVSKGSRAGEH